VLPVSKEFRAEFVRKVALKINAHTIRAEHDAEVSRIESEAFQSLARKLRASDII